MKKKPIRRAKQLRIGDRRKIESLISPVRQEIVDCVGATGRSSITEIGKLVGRPADSIYYHVRALVRAGLLIPAGKRSAGRREEALFDVPADNIRLEYRPGDAKNAEVVIPVIASLTRRALRDFESGFVKGLARVQGRYRNLWAARAVGWLTRDELRRVNAALKSIHTILSAGRPGPGREQCTISWVLAPRQARSRPRRGAT